MHGSQDNLAQALAAAAVCFFACGIFAKPPAAPQKLARPPKWPADVQDAFFADARQKLVGTRPDYGKSQALAGGGSAENGAEQAAGGWSRIIDAESIETEIKRIGQELAKAKASASDFQGGGYKDYRRQFSLLAALFAVDSEYDGDVRWKEAAPTFRELFSRAGHNCKAPTDQSYAEAMKRKQNLADLIAGNRPKPSSADRKADWSKVSDRPPLMQRMNTGHEDRLKKWLANKNEYALHRDDVRQEAQVVAMIAQIIGERGFEYADDENYTKWAGELRQAATDVSTATEQNNFERAQEAGNRMTKACADCHESFRG